MLILVGVQLTISWVIVRVLQELSERDACVDEDLRQHLTEERIRA